jgi:hypothetical protein
MTKPIMVIIDEAKWCTGLFVRNDSRCALGWLMETAGLCLVNNGIFMSAGVEVVFEGVYT